MSELDSNSKAKNKVYRKTYIPLESDPEIFTSLIHKIGVSSNLEFVDIFSLDESDLTLVPHPVFALILAFPDTDLYHKQIDQSEIGRPDYAGSGDGEDAVWFQQTIHNACGLYGILHAVSNGRARSFVEPESALAKLLQKCTPLKPHERALALEDSKEIETAHASAARLGRTAVPDLDEAVEHHYVCFVKSLKTGKLYELDGDKKGPLYTGVTLHDEDDVLCKDALRVVTDYLQRDGDEKLTFSLMALVQAQ